MPRLSGHKATLTPYPGGVNQGTVFQRNLERVMNPRRGCRSLAGGRGKQTRQSAAPPKWRAASRNPSPAAEIAMPMRNLARWTARKRQILYEPPRAALAQPLSPTKPEAPPD